MTAIANVFCREFIACGSDSFLTQRVNGLIEHVETQRPKIFALDGVPGAISYWGFAGLERLNIADELERLARRARSFSTLELFATAVRDHLNDLFEKHPSIPRADRGIGLHIVGYEEIRGFRIPELFLATNFKGIPYDELSERIGCSRRTNLTITGDSGDDEYLRKHAEFDFRKLVYDYLDAGNIVYFNNGEPELFTPTANALLESMKILNRRGALSGDCERWRHLAKAPLEIIADLQRAYVKDEYRVVGGRIHDLVIQSDGRMFSDSGVVSSRWADR